jgi:hypothetical protein
VTEVYKNIPYDDDSSDKQWLFSDVAQVGVDKARPVDSDDQEAHVHTLEEVAMNDNDLDEKVVEWSLLEDLREVMPD